MVAVYSTGGGALAFTGLVGKAASVQVAVAAAASETALAGAVAAEAAGACAVAEAALSVAIATESAAATAAGVTAANIWNPAGWAIGAVLIGASQRTSWSVTWECYKPIIGEAVIPNSPCQPITLTELIAHPNIRHVLVGTRTALAGLPEIEVENEARELYLLRGIVLPWGSAAYHAERIDEYDEWQVKHRFKAFEF